MRESRNKPKVGDADRILFDSGVAEGRQEMLAEVLSMLETEYMHPDLDRRDIKAQAILELARELNTKLKAKLT